jgi:hypothetical protein
MNNSPTGILAEISASPMFMTELFESMTELFERQSHEEWFRQPPLVSLGSAFFGWSVSVKDLQPCAPI